MEDPKKFGPTVERILKYAAVSAASCVVAAMILQLPGGILYIICVVGATLLWGLAQIAKVFFAGIIGVSKSTFNMLNNIRAKTLRPPTKAEVRNFLLGDHRDTTAAIDRLPIDELEREDMREEAKERLKDRMRGEF